MAEAYGNNWSVPTVADQGWQQGYYGNLKSPFNYKCNRSLSDERDFPRATAEFGAQRSPGLVVLRAGAQPSRHRSYARK